MRGCGVASIPSYVGLQSETHMLQLIGTLAPTCLPGWRRTRRPATRAAGSRAAPAAPPAPPAPASALLSGRPGPQTAGPGPDQGISAEMQSLAASPHATGTPPRLHSRRRSGQAAGGQMGGGGRVPLCLRAPWRGVKAAVSPEALALCNGGPTFVGKRHRHKGCRTRHGGSEPLGLWRQP